MDRIWIAGANGQIGAALARLLDTMDNELLCTDIDEVDVTDEDSVDTYATINRPNVIINCSGTVDHRLCNENPDEAYKVNAIGTRNLAVHANNLNAKFVHISTDDVFDSHSGHNQIFNEFDTPHPETIYAKSKYAGEQIIQTLMHKYFIIRSSWVYGMKNDYINTVHRLLQKGEKVSASKNEHAVPTYSADIAYVIESLLHTSDYGIYHITSKGSCSRYEYACEIAKLLGYRQDMIVSVKTPDKCTVLDNMMLRLIGISGLDDWKETLRDYISSSKEKDV
ncbi:MAG: NAD(P)-dependent oxidoreductase [Oscillospiraceae bacterium]|nr:NAD(P)-dependent oxidoreductase [Oscillospiraceae bacterium]